MIDGLKNGSVGHEHRAFKPTAQRHEFAVPACRGQPRLDAQGGVIEGDVDGAVCGHVAGLGHELGVGDSGLLLAEGLAIELGAGVGGGR